MKHLLVATLVLVATVAGARDLSVVLHNAGTTDVVVEDQNKVAVAELLPGQSSEVRFVQPQWLKLGQEVYRFDVTPLFRLPRTKTPPVIYLRSDGKLYLMPSGVREVGPMPPPQPRGFPIRHSKKVDLP
jgi:hypothetical protein